MVRNRRRRPAGTRLLRTKRINTSPPGAFSALDTPSFRVERLTDEMPMALFRKLGTSSATARLVKNSLTGGPTLEQFARTHPKTIPELRRLRACSFLPPEDPLHIVDASPEGGFVLSDTPFVLAITYQNASYQPCVVASATVLWAGDPFTVEVDLIEQQGGSGKAVIAFDRERTLPVGQAEFLVSLYRADGAQSTFRRTVFVLPSNPLSLSLDARRSDGHRHMERQGRLSP